MSRDLYRYKDVDGDQIAVFMANIKSPAYDLGSGINIRTTEPGGCSIPDDEIPSLISALQHYMSMRAREMAKAANGKR